VGPRAGLDRCGKSRHNIFVNDYLFLISHLHVPMFTHLPQEVSYYLFRSYKLIKWEHLYKRLLTHCGRVTQICVFNAVKLGTSASSP